MIQPKFFVNELLRNNLGPVIQVPCSYLTHFLNYLWESRRIPTINPANEAICMGVAAGEYLGSGKIPVVAIQNSGFMNTLNALTSLHQIYNIPAFLIVTWRGEGGFGKDAPEHDITGQNLTNYMNLFKLPFEVINENAYKDQIKRLKKKAQETKKPVVLIIKKNTFSPYKIINPSKTDDFEMDRYHAIKTIKETASSDVLFISGTGYPTRDSFTIKDSPDFYIIGSMGHAFAIALGVSGHTDKKIIVLDGDGGALMHAGGFSSLSPKRHKNIIYIALDNGMYESTGGQPTASKHTDFINLARAFRFKNIHSIKTIKSLKIVLRGALIANEATFIHVKVKAGGESKLKRVTDVYTGPQITKKFMKQFNS